MTAPQPPKTYGDSNLTAQQITEMSSGDRKQYIAQHMSPQDRDGYLQQAASDQAGGGPFFRRMFEEIAAEEKAQQQSDAYRQQSMQQATGADTRYVTGLSPSDMNYQSVDHSQLQQYVDSGLDAGQIGAMSDGYHQMSSTFDQIAKSLTDAVNKSQGEWEGDAAESARGFFTSLQQWADGNSQNARLASEVTYEQSDAASTAKNTMPAPIPFSWASEAKSWATSNPFDLVDNVKASVAKQKESQEAHDQAAQVMTTYDHSLYGAASKQPVFAQPPKFDMSTNASAVNVSGSIDGSAASGYSGGPGLGGGGGGGHAYSPGGGTPGSVSGVTGAPILNAGAKIGAANNAQKTRAQGYQPPPGAAGPSAAANAANNPLSAMGGMPIGPMGGFGGFDDEAAGGGSGRAGRGGGFGPGAGSGLAAGSGSAAEGARTGVRAGGAGAAEAAGAAGGRGAAGRGGMSGMGGMGHGKGEGEEDAEHQRPSWLVEADPDDVFGTNERTAPPVIGE
ncbi:hypothetical protein [Amycolatopsis pigmentata]|uniref:PPE family protein n=1 Tax=Amycolatopsis pigmentata TaxID=450801 RepID=A0ABW5FT43_9PSEU